MIALQIYLHEGKYYLRDDAGNYYPFPVGSGASGGAGGGGGGSDIYVQDEGLQLSGKYKTLNFAGPGVSVVDSGGKRATITIPGYVIASLTTVQRLALTPTTALIVEDTDTDMYYKWSTVTNDWSPF